MRRWITVLLCVCSLLSLSGTSFAAQGDTDYWKDRYGIPEPRREDYEDSDVYSAAWDAWYAGFSAFFIRESQAEYVRQEEEAARRVAEEQAVSAEVPSVESTESEGVKNDNSIQPVEDDSSSKYPIGSYVDPSGIVWSPDGTRLSPSSALAESPAENAGLSSSDLADTDALSPAADLDTLEVIAGLVSDIATDPSVSTVEDLRPEDSPVEVLTGLKALVTSVFGEYTPVTTTSVVIQTVGNDTNQYLVETVAPGAAGVDYEWLAGVFLFGIMLFCLMKLLGGVLK